MKILTVVGARPQFIKAAVVSREFAKRTDCEEVIFHTGQHFDYNMSERFFNELDIPHPKLNLGISGGTHTQMTARMLVGLEEAMASERPDLVLLYGDTNSTLAAALTATKLGFPVVHVEAGPRSRSLANPEEINRVCTDHISTLLFAATQSSMDNLLAEDLGDRVILTGDTMYDAFLFYRDKAQETEHHLIGLDGEEIALTKPYVYLTCHRAENTDSPQAITEILAAAAELSCCVYYPVHPRSQNLACSIVKDEGFSNINLIDPVGYLTSVYLTQNADHIITDSGGVQREAFFAGVPCTVPMTLLAWPDIMVDGRCVLVPPKKEAILDAMDRKQVIRKDYQPFGDGRAAEKITYHLIKYFGGK